MFYENDNEFQIWKRKKKKKEKENQKNENEMMTCNLPPANNFFF